MKFNDIKNGSILIIKDSSKDSVLNEINSQKGLINIKLVTLSELKKKYFFDYTNEAVFYVCKKYNVIPEIGKIYIDNLYYLSGDLFDEKLVFLNEVKDNLLRENLLITNDLFKEYLKGKDIILYNLINVDKFYTKIFDELKDTSNVQSLNDEEESTKKKLYKVANMEDEVVFVASKIAKLIKQGIDINKTKLANVSEAYNFTINKTFKLFHIPVELPNTESAEGTILIKKFKELYRNDMPSVIEELKKFVKDKSDEDLLKKIINVVNSYVWCSNYEEVKDLLFKDLNRIKCKKDLYKNAVRTIDFPDDIVDESEYVFLINFNQGIIPTNSKDEDYLNDSIKEKLGISTSIDLNYNKTLEVRKKIGETKNLIVTYSAHDLTNELYISNAYDPDLFDEEEVTLDFTNSHDFNKLKLVSEKDENKKFGTVTKNLILLNNYYKNEPYASYDNSFKGINIADLNNFLNHKLSLSYTSMNTYYQCSYRYYLQYILKLDKYEDTFQQVIGNVFHKILSECFKDEYDFEGAWVRELDKSNYEFNNMEKFFLGTLKNELILVIETIKEQISYTSLQKALYENEVKVNVDEHLNITFKGYIDKVLYDEFEGKTIAVIIDYKTGNPELNINNSIYGLEMQLPVYIYLMKHTNEIKNVTIGGFYLQKILNNIQNPEKRKESLKLQGYSNSNLEILDKVDSSYVSSKIIKSLRMSNNGFYSYSKVINDEQIDKLSNTVEEKISEAGKNIINGKFDINPKQIGTKLLGCNFCKFKDICYRKNADIVKLKEVKFLGGENDAEMD